MRRWIPALGAAVAMLLTSIPGAAVPLIGDQTTVRLTDGRPADAGLDIGLLGSASANALGKIVFPITGGDVEVPLLTGSIAHDGSGVSLTDGSATLDLENFLIDLDAPMPLLSALATIDDGSGGGTILEPDFALFEVRACLTSTGIDPCIDDDGSLLLNGFGLDYTAGAAQALNDLFLGGEPVIAGGEQFGVAYVDLRLVPEPGTLLLVSSGLAGLAAQGRRRA